jgi:hypothetical protein
MSNQKFPAKEDMTPKNNKFSVCGSGVVKNEDDEVNTDEIKIFPNIKSDKKPFNMSGTKLLETVSSIQKQQEEKQILNDHSLQQIPHLVYANQLNMSSMLDISSKNMIMSSVPNFTFMNASPMLRGSIAPDYSEQKSFPGGITSYIPRILSP